MNILILYFSGTGNTAHIGKYLREALVEAGDNATCASIEKFNFSRIEAFDHLVFGFPIFACDIPDFLKDDVERFPLTKDKTASIYCTKAIASGSALKHVQKQFERIGYKITGWADISMPGSDGLAFVKKDSPMVKKMELRDFSSIPEADVLVTMIQNSNIQAEVLLPISLGQKLVGGLLGHAYPLFENNLKKKFWADEKCISCKKCEKICPAGNISVNENVEFGDRCYLCMRCIHQCPVEAIQIGKSTIDKFRWKGPNKDFNPLQDLK